MTIATRVHMMLGVAALTAVNACSDAANPIAPVPRLQQALSGNTITVANVAELTAALSPENAGSRILVRAGTYDIDQPLTVPDGVTLEGEGTMLSDAAGLPAGFGAGVRTEIRMAANVAGDMLTLGNGVTIRRLALVDRAGRAGNVVAVYSRAPGDRVAASVVESEIVVAGALLYGLAVQTRNLNLGDDPAPHAGAVVTARMARSLVRGGRGVFAFNFAPLANVAVDLRENVLGVLVANGGVSLPDAVHDSNVRIRSRGNLYRREAINPCTAPPAPAWNLTGGSGPNTSPVPVSETARNTLRMHSVGDRIESFTTAILAIGGRRFFGAPSAGPSTDNELEMELINAVLSTPSCGGAQFVRDLDLKGAFADREALAPGDGNTLHAVLRGVSGSGLRFNLYANAAGPSGPLVSPFLGTGNRLQLVGNAEAFAQANRQIDPAPSSEFFASHGH